MEGKCADVYISSIQSFVLVLLYPNPLCRRWDKREASAAFG